MFGHAAVTLAEIMSRNYSSFQPRFFACALENVFFVCIIYTVNKYRFKTGILRFYAGILRFYTIFLRNVTTKCRECVLRQIHVSLTGVYRYSTVCSWNSIVLVYRKCSSRTALVRADYKMRK